MKTAIIPCSSVVSLNRLASEMNKCMTTKQLAEVLGVDVRTVNNAVERLLGSTFQKSEIKVVSNGGRPTKVFTEKQATIIKQEIQKHHNHHILLHYRLSSGFVVLRKLFLILPVHHNLQMYQEQYLD